MQGLFPSRQAGCPGRAAHRLPAPSRAALSLKPIPVGLSPFRRKPKTHLCFWKSPSSPSPSSLTFLPPPSTPRQRSGREVQLSQLQILPGHFTALPGHHQPQRRARAPSSPFHFPRSLLFITRRYSGEECSLSRGKGCCRQDSAG